MKNANKPAYPHTNEVDGFKTKEGDYVELGGLTKRERFAMAAMQGVLANSDFLQSIEKVGKERNEEPDEMTARFAVAYADALLKELEDTDEER